MVLEQQCVSHEEANVRKYVVRPTSFDSKLCYFCRTLTDVDMEKQMPKNPNATFKFMCYMRMLGVSYCEHKTNDYTWQQVNVLPRHQEILLSNINSHELSWFGHVYRKQYYKERRKVGITEDNVKE